MPLSISAIDASTLAISVFVPSSIPAIPASYVCSSIAPASKAALSLAFSSSAAAFICAMPASAWAFFELRSLIVAGRVAIALFACCIAAFSSLRVFFMVFSPFSIWSLALSSFFSAFFFSSSYFARLSSYSCFFSSSSSWASCLAVSRRPSVTASDSAFILSSFALSLSSCSGVMEASSPESFT